jgi:hypothetical protein
MTANPNIHYAVFNGIKTDSGNALVRGRSHWAVQRRWRNEWVKRIADTLGEGPYRKPHNKKLPPKVLKYVKSALRKRWPPALKMKLRVIVSRTRPLQDHDNFLTGLKGLIDALNVTGWMVDDDKENFELDTVGSKETPIKSRKETKTEVTIEYE